MFGRLITDMAAKEQKGKNELNVKEYNFAQATVDQFEEYKFFAGMTDKLSQRRQQTHTIFEGILTALLVLVYFFVKDTNMKGLALALPVCLVSVLGVLVCIIWNNIISNYKELIGLRFKILMEMEKRLEGSVGMYNIEWEYFSSKNSAKEPFKFSIYEKFLPLIFGIVFVLMGIGIFFFKYL